MCIEFNQKISELGIKCRRCLDTQLLWKNNEMNEIDKMDKRNKYHFIVIRCSCYVFESIEKKIKDIVCYSLSSNLIYNDIPLFNAEDNSYIVRLPIIRKLYEKHKNQIDELDLLDLDLLQILKYYES